MYSLIPFALYLVAAVLLVRRSTERDAPRWGLPQVVALAGFTVHAWILFGSIRTGDGVALAITDSASLVGWVVAGTTLVAGALQPLAAMPAALYALAGVLAVGTGVVRGFHHIAHPKWEMTAHISLAALAAGWLSIAAVLVLLLTWQNTRLRTRQPLGVLAALPPLETVEVSLFRALLGGYVALSLALFTGFFFVYNVVEQHLVHKMTLAIVAWLIFGVLLWGRWRYGWRGRRALRFTIGGFVTLALAYFGTKFVLEVLLGRQWG